jgi:hypothetical protein
VNFDNYVIIAIFSLFLLSSKTRATALVLLAAYFLYYNFALDYHGLNRYMAIGTIEILAGCYLFYGHMLTANLDKVFCHQDVSIAETYFLLVVINVLGGILYWYYFSKEYYGIMTLTIMIIQIIILSWRVLKDGKLVGRYSYIYPLFGAFVSNINQRHSFLQSKKKKS